jgi:hypothetical protein
MPKQCHPELRDFCGVRDLLFPQRATTLRSFRAPVISQQQKGCPVTLAKLTRKLLPLSPLKPLHGLTRQAAFVSISTQ